MALEALFDAERPSESGSLRNGEYWWYRVRRQLLRVVLEPAVPRGSRILEIGSADGPSVGWMAELGDRVATDLDPRGLPPGGVCASATQLPFANASMDVVAAFDVIEHIADERAVLREVHRVLTPRGVLLVSVPAYQWAWSAADVAAGHHRRYTRRGLRRALAKNGFEISRATYIFTGTFPAFAADRLLARVRGHDPERVVNSSLAVWQEQLLVRLSRLDECLLDRFDLPFGSSVVAAARRSP